MRHIGLVACSNQKCPPTDGTSPRARELYVSPLFRASLKYSETRCDHTYVLSAMYGLVQLDQRIAPYNLQLKQLTHEERNEWGRLVVRKLAELHPDEPLQVVTLAGSDYVRPIREANSGGAWRPGPRWTISEPLAGMQIGQRLHFLNRANWEARP